MEILPLALVLISAVSHAIWNYLAKDSEDKESFMFLLNLYSTALFLPIFGIIITNFKLPYEIIPFLLISGLAETIYFISLGKAYKTGDLSIVYPLARSSPIFVAVLASILLEETINVWGIIGISMVIIGVYLLHLKSLSFNDISLTLRSLNNSSSIYAIIAALGTTIYSLSDKKGVTLTDPILYSFWLGPIITVMMGSVVFCRKDFKSVSKATRGKNIRILVSGFLMKGGYLLVLVALSLEKVSYILSIRQLSIVIGTVFGLKFLKEKNPRIKIIGSIIIFLGVYILGVLA